MRFKLLLFCEESFESSIKCGEILEIYLKQKYNLNK